jgi:PAS domain-containing protein
MNEFSLWVSVSAAVIAVIELFLLNRRRRLLLLDPQRRRFFVRHLRLEARHRLRLPRTQASFAPQALADSQQAAPCPQEVALLYVDSEGRCAAANEAARRLLQSPEEEVRLSDVLSGTGEDITRLLDRITREAVVQCYPAVLARLSGIPV